MGELRELIARRRARLALPRTNLLLCALRKADQAREQLREAEMEIHACFNSDMSAEYSSASYHEAHAVLIPDAEINRLRQAWLEFRQEGGVTGTDFANWLEGKPLARLNGKTGRARNHLRLVATQPGVPHLRRPIHVNNNDGPTAA
jgi:hypothetical protein